MAMALRTATLKVNNPGFVMGLMRWTHAVARPAAPTDALIAHPSISSPSFVLPEFDRPIPGRDYGGFGFPSSHPDASMELMAVPKKRTSHHKKRIRNGPKALKPVPVIIRCKSCGRVKLPHFFCCSGHRGQANEQS